MPKKAKSETNLVKNIIKQRLSFVNYLNLFDKVKLISEETLQVNSKLADIENSNKIILE